MATAYSRVTVVNGARRVDLALPSALPLADVMPQLCRYCFAEERPEAPENLAVARLGGGRIGLDQTLDDAGVVDGDVLELIAGPEGGRAACVEDVRDAVEDAVDQSGRLWDSRATLGCTLSLAGAGLLAAVLFPDARQTGSVGALVAAVLVAAGLLAGTWFGADRGYRLPTQLLAAVGCLWGGVAGWLGAGLAGWPGLSRYAGGLAGALLLAVAAMVVTRLATAHLGAAIVLAIAGAAVGITAAAPADPAIAVRVAAALAVLVVGALPRVSLTVGGLASADYQVRKSALLTQQALAGLIRRSTALLTGALLGAAAVGVLGGLWLAQSRNTWDRMLSLSVGLTLLLRSRIFSRLQHALPPRLAGAAVLVINGVYWALAHPPVRPWFGVLAVAIAAGLTALAALPLSDITHARVKQVLNWLEVLAIVGLIVVAAATLGLFAWAAQVAHVSI